jgi:hypothetical protein
VAVGLVDGEWSMSQITSGRSVSMKGVPYDEDIRFAAVFSYRAGEFWTNTFRQAWAYPAGAPHPIL